ncbi:hypothetical protein RCO48_05050 [Peribacillus frigoritolerans]|nr:hypothetical protein [Peribacillus frigoritolerans]
MMPDPFFLSEPLEYSLLRNNIPAIQPKKNSQTRDDWECMGIIYDIDEREKCR